MNGTRSIGVPFGTKWARNKDVLNNTDGRNKDTHKALLKAKEIAMWLVAVKT